LIKNFDHSEYESERKVFEYLSLSLPETTDIVVFPNYELFDRAKEAYVECDAIVVTRAFIAIVELKDWAGQIVVNESKWMRGLGFIDSPHIVNNRKCKVLKSYIQHVLSGVHESMLPFVQSVVALTSERAKVEGATPANQALPNLAAITFDGMEELGRYLKLRLHADSKHAEKILTDFQFRRLIDRLDHDRQSQTVDYADQIPGYRICEDKESTDSYVTYVAERSPNIDNHLYRLRVFGKLNSDPAIAEKQVRSLKAISRLPYHPGIRAVQSHPNERSLIVEVSDWTETQTLSNVLTEHSRLDWRRAAHIARDIAQALDFIHKSNAALIHRNVQPKSILVCSDGHAQLTDFDLAFDPNSELTVLGVSDDDRLSVSFTAPEVFLGRSDFSSDVYSLGAVICLAISGSEPVTGADTDSLIARGLQESSVTEDVQSKLITLVKSMLAKNPQHRPSAASVATVLTEILEPKVPVLPLTVVAIKEEMPYTERRKISEGATAEVYQVDNHGELFIHKVFKPSVAREQALHERDILRAVDKLHLPILFPRVRHFSEVEGHRWCLAVDLVPGIPIRDLIFRGERPDLDLFTNVARVLLEALCRLHEPGELQHEIIHNDINPNNVLFDEASRAVGLIDFGSASAAGVVTLRGTPGYVDSAQVSRSEMNACAQGDLFALGRTLHQWLCCQADLKESNGDGLRRGRLVGWLEHAYSIEGARYESASVMLKALDEALKVVEPPPPETEEIEPETAPAASVAPVQPLDAEPTGSSLSNPFVTYLNTLHNVSAGNANALAEYQATNQYFGSIYEASPIVDDIYRRLSADGEVIIVLSGHAGDGKSTIALDVLKRLKRLKVDQSLSEPPKPIENGNLNGRPISILKDMSEHPPEERVARFNDALKVGSGSWLIVTNTGPLLNTLKDLRAELEEHILELLDRPISGALDDERHRIDGFEKPIFVANLSKVDNVDMAVRVLGKIAVHPAWDSCQGCNARQNCPINNNIATINGSPELNRRVSWMYRLLTSYERRLTMRQMSAHIAFSITGGTECASVTGLVDQIGAKRLIRQGLFSELFFGYSDGVRLISAQALYCVEQLQSYASRGRTRPAVELKLQNEHCSEYAPLSTPALVPFEHWRKSKTKVASNNASARAALRRLLFMFGRVKDEEWWKTFVQDFAGSEKLRDWENWRVQGDLPTALAARRVLIRQVLSVLREHCTGFTSLPNANEKLYITLRRDDMETTQPVQVIIGEYSEGDFELQYDRVGKMPRISYIPSGEQIFMRLPLPLLDFVSRRSRGDFGQSLDPIYVNQLDLFCSQLVASRRLASEDIRLLSVSVTGVQKIFQVDIADSKMEIF
jgi:serine/threonine protein kinase